MKAPDIVDAYFDAWNLHAPTLIVDCFGSDGIYCDPNVPQGVTGQAIGDFASELFRALPDLHLDMSSRGSLGDGRIVVEWLLRAGSTVALPGVDFIVVRGDKIASVRGYYDRLTLHPPAEKSG